MVWVAATFALCNLAAFAVFVGDKLAAKMRWRRVHCPVGIFAGGIQGDGTTPAAALLGTASTIIGANTGR